MVTTALGTSRVWVTLGHGIVNEIYWPATGTPQIRDLGFIVSGPFGWVEIKREMLYKITVPAPYVPLPQIVHEGQGYRLVLELATDPLRDVVLVSFQLTGEGTRLYALLAPHLGNSGMDNNARAGEELLAWKGENALCLTCDCGFPVERGLCRGVRRMARLCRERTDGLELRRGHAGQRRPVRRAAGKRGHAGAGLR